MSLLIDFENKEGQELSDVLNDLGIIIGKANIAEETSEAKRYYNMAIIILEAFTSDDYL